MLHRLKKLYESSLWIKISVHFHKDPEREYLNVNIDRYDLDSMYFPTTNYRRTDHSRVVFLMSWKYLCLQKDCCKLQKVEEKLFLLDKLQQYFGVVFPSFYFKLAIGEVIFWYMCQKKKKMRSERPSPIDFSTWKEQGRESWSLLLSIRVLVLSACVQMIYSKKVDFTPREIPSWSICVPWSVSEWNNASAKPASCFPSTFT